MHVLSILSWILEGDRLQISRVLCACLSAEASVLEMSAVLLWLPELAALLLWFSESPSLHLCFPFLHHRLETLKAADWSSHWVHPIWFQYCMDHCPKLPDGQSFKHCCFIYFICFIIFWCFRWEDKFRTCYSRLPRRGPYNVLVLILKFPVWFFSLIQVYRRVAF